MNSKVDRVIREYGLSEVETQLIDYWTDDSDERRSLRELAEYFNKKLLYAEMERAGMTKVDGEVENTYYLLTADDVSIGVRTQAESTLERNGLDPDQLQRDFVSHQAIHTYLTKHKGVEHSSEPAAKNAVANTEKTIQRLKSRFVAVAEKRIRSLRDAGTITLGTFSVLISIRVVCEDCGTHIDVYTLLDNKSCDCNLDE